MGQGKNANLETMSINFLDKLNEEQKKAVTHPHGPLLIVAGAGTGKTTVITSRLAWLIKEGLTRPEEILAITFTDKAANEMQERVDQLLPFGYLDLSIATFHAFGQRILERHGLEIGLPNDFKLLTQTEGWLLVRRHLSKFNLDYYRPLGNPTKFIHALIKHFSRCKDEEISPKDYLNHAENIKLNHDQTDQWESETKRLNELANAYHTYNQLLLDNNALDFGDLINYTLRLFRARPHILAAYRKQFKYILVDEFQDTNLAQYELIKLLAGSPESANLTVVGDHKQAIYKFRGASLSNILHFNQDFPNAAKICLIKNYRSAQNILDLSHQFIQLNNGRALAQENFDQEKLNQKLEATKEGDGQIEFLNTSTAEGEARTVVKKIMELKNENNSWNDFAILLRANNQADIFINTLEEAGIPEQFLASAGLYRAPVVLDILAYLRLLDDYHENTAAYRVCHFAPWQIPSEDLIKIIHFTKKKAWSLFFTLKNHAFLSLDDETRKKIEKILSLVARHTALARDNKVRKVVQLFLEESGYLKNLIEREKDDPLKYSRDILYLNKFIDTIAEFEQTQKEPTIKNYLAELDFILDSGEEGSLSNLHQEGSEAVKIMTVHSAKGLEFKYVFIVNLVELKFPATNRGEPIAIPNELVKELISNEDSFLEEERRLFYVAMTRAKEGLYFTAARSYGGARERKPSRFLYETGLVSKNQLNPKTAEKVRTANNSLDQVVTKISPVELMNDGKTQNKTTNQYLIPKKFSFTQLRAFQTCPYQYKFAHVLKLPVRGNASFSFGKTMHSTLQKFYQRLIELNTVNQLNLFSVPEEVANPNQLKTPTLEDLLKFYEESWIDDWYLDSQQKERYREEGRRSLKEFYALNQDHWTKPMVLEKGFNLRLGGENLIGAIDRVDELSDGTVEIIDYKTGQPKKEDVLESEDKEQLLIYQLATVDVLQKKPSILSFYYLNQNKKISFLGTGEEIEKLKEKIKKTIEAIKTSDFKATPSPQICRNCDFRNICEFRA